MRIDPDAIEAARPGDREIALLAAEVRRLQAVINSEESTLTDAEREAIMGVANFVCELPASDETKVTLRKTAAALRGLLERTR